MLKKAPTVYSFNRQRFTRKKKGGGKKERVYTISLLLSLKRLFRTNNRKEKGKEKDTMFSVKNTIVTMRLKATTKCKSS